MGQKERFGAGIAETLWDKRRSFRVGRAEILGTKRQFRVGRAEILGTKGEV